MCSVAVLCDVLRGRSPESVGLLWRRIAQDELSRCSRRFDVLSADERDSACNLLDWYIANFGDDDSVLDSWLLLYRSDNERLLRTSASLLDWYSARVKKLSLRRYSQVWDLADWFFDTYGYCKPEWSQALHNR